MRSKRSKRIVATLAVMSSMSSAGAFSAACTASAGNILSVGSLQGDLCAATDQLIQTCGDTTPIGGARDAIYQIQLGPVNSLTFSVTGTGFAPYVAMISGPACNSLNQCADEDVGSAGTAVVIDPPDNLPAGVYYLFITDQFGVAAACGPFSLVTTGPVPVTLQKFSVE